MDGTGLEVRACATIFCVYIDIDSSHSWLCVFSFIWGSLSGANTSLEDNEDNAYNADLRRFLRVRSFGRQVKMPARDVDVKLCLTWLIDRGVNDVAGIHDPPPRRCALPELDLRVALLFRPFSDNGDRACIDTFRSILGDSERTHLPFRLLRARSSILQCYMGVTRCITDQKRHLKHVWCAYVHLQLSQTG